MAKVTNVELDDNLKPLTKHDLRWLAVRKREAKRIDPSNCDVDWAYRYVADPYDLRNELPLELQYVNREWFVSRPGRKIWVWLRDLTINKQSRVIRTYGLKLHPFKAITL